MVYGNVCQHSTVTSMRKPRGWHNIVAFALIAKRALTPNFLTPNFSKKKPPEGGFAFGNAVTYCMCWPPLMAMLAPVTKAASSDDR
jgi:hypothetical protein